MSHNQDSQKRDTVNSLHHNNKAQQYKRRFNNRDSWRQNQYQQPSNNSNNPNPFIGNASTDQVIEEIRQSKKKQSKRANHLKEIDLKHNDLKYNNTSHQYKHNSNNRVGRRQHQHQQPMHAKNNSNPFIGNVSSDKVMEEIKHDLKENDAKVNDLKKIDPKVNNHGWTKGWSLEKEFLKQSLSISIKPEHKKYLHKREVDGNYPREKYRRRRGEDKKHILHWGQRKLLLSEIEFLNHYINYAKVGKDGYKLIVYAGAAAGTHIPLLIGMYDDIIMHLWDPNEFCNAVKHIDRIKVHKEYFTNQVAEMYSKLDRDILFVSDIRTADNNKQDSNQCEKSIQKDNQLQMEWTKTISSNGNLVAAMLKFRLPYPHLIDTKWHNQLYLNGTIKLGVWAPVTSTETRLHVKPNEDGTIKQNIYNCKAYEEQLFWFNVNVRQSIVDNSKYYSPEFGVINSYDCWAECLILEQYFLYYKQMKSVSKMDVINMVNKISNSLDSHRCLLTRPSDTNPTTIHQDNPHGLIGYEGILYINPQQTKKLHDDIITEVEEQGMDTWILPIINPMLKIERIDPNKISKYGWSVLPCYNRPLYNMISINNCIYLMPLNGFGDVSFKINPQYASFYQKCFGDFFACCMLTGYLIDNHGVKPEKSNKFEFSIIDILLAKSYEDDDYYKRRKQIKYITNNYEQYKHEVTNHEIFKFIPVKLVQCPSQTGGQRNIQLFQNKIVKNGNANVTTSNKQQLEWNDVHFDTKQYQDPPIGYYFNEVELNSRIGAILWRNNQHRNVLLDGLSFSEL